jgi:hypothetical protein
LNPRQVMHDTLRKLMRMYGVSGQRAISVHVEYAAQPA